MLRLHRPIFVTQPPPRQSLVERLANDSPVWIALEEGIVVGFEVLDVCVLLDVVMVENGIAVGHPVWNGT